MFDIRLEKVCSALNNLGYHGMYITNLTNIRYLTGFTGSAGVLLIINNQSYFLTDGRYIQQSKEQVKNAKIHIIDSNYFDLIKGHNILSGSNINIGFESSHMSFSYYSNYYHQENNNYIRN